MQVATECNGSVRQLLFAAWILDCNLTKSFFKWWHFSLVEEDAGITFDMNDILGMDKEVEKKKGIERLWVKE